MRKTRILALLMTLFMLASLMPMNVFAAGDETWTELVKGMTGGSFTDTTAESGKSYEYTVLGSDGSTQTIKVLADGTTPDEESKWGTIDDTTGTGTYYQLVEDNSIVSGEKYLIVNTDSGSGYAMLKTGKATGVSISTDGKITTIDDAAVFTITLGQQTSYYITDEDGKYLLPRVTYDWNNYKYVYSLLTQYSTKSSVTIKPTDVKSFTFSNTYYNTGYINFVSGADGFTTASTESSLYLFREVTAPAGTVYNVTWNIAANELMTECNGLNKSNYTDSSWADFVTALAAANNVYKYTGTYNTSDEAKEAMAKLDALEAAKNALVKGEVFYPDIDWKRTYELKSTTTDAGKLVTGVKFTEAGTDGTYPTVFWDWDTVSALTTDPDMTVWDYGTTDQYSTKTSNSKIQAATWVHRDASGATPDWSEVASVRKFEGTFDWPADYDFDDTAALVSVNDSYYQPIYDYIANSGNQEYIDATAGKYILPVNDDIYVFMYAEGTDLTADTFMNYLVFWTGTSGKGVWSENSTGSADWLRTVPPTFNEVYANRSFHRSVPNLNDTVAGRTSIDTLDNALATSGWNTELYMNQSDGWYSFADTAGIANVLKTNYPNGVAAGTKMHIDIYCFDNDSDGGMDKLELKLTKTADTHKSVEVRYYLDAVTNPGDAAHYLDHSFIQDKAIDDEITLIAGTDNNELNYMKAAAIKKAGNVDVYDGEQQGKVPYVVVDSDENVINVLYITKTDKRVITLQAESGERKYSGNQFTLNNVSISEAGYPGVKVETGGNGEAVLPDGNTIKYVYSVVSETEPGIYANNFQFNGASLEIRVYDKSGNDITKSYTIKKEPGTLTILYEPEPETFTYDFGVNNKYSKGYKTAYEEVLNGVERGYAIPSTTSENLNIDDLKSNNTITYTPTSINTGETIDLTLTFTGDYKVTKSLTFIPESNVLYEENFAQLTGGSSWSKAGTSNDNSVTDNEYSVITGYTGAYDADTGFSNSTALKADLTLGADGETFVTGDAVKFEFSGRGFDLISECGTNTGMLIVGVKKWDETAKEYKAVKAYVVDTYFCGDGKIIDKDTAGDDILDYQVPVVRDLKLDYGKYEITVYGMLTQGAGAASAQQGISTAAVYDLDDGGNTSFEASLFEAAGMSEFLGTDIIVTFMDDNSILNGGTGVEITTTENVKSNEPTSIFEKLKDFFKGFGGKSTFESDVAVETAPDAYVYIDALRVYKPLDDMDSDAYDESEKGTEYYSVYDFVKTSVNDLTDYTYDAAVYIEYDGSVDIENIATYKDQGPENEVYLAPGASIAFGLSGYNYDDTVQVGAKQIGDGVIATGIDIATTATEMYYDVVVEYDPGLDIYYVVISNDGTSGILALSGLKVGKNITAVASTSLGERIIELNKETAAQFKPEKFEVTAPESTKTGRSFTIKTTASANVAKITIELPNGTTIEPTASNRKAVEAGRVKYLTFSKGFKQTVAGTYTYKITAYDAIGNASAPVEVTVTVQ